MLTESQSGCSDVLPDPSTRRWLGLGLLPLVSLLGQIPPAPLIWGLSLPWAQSLHSHLAMCVGWLSPFGGRDDENLTFLWFRGHP